MAGTGLLLWNQQQIRAQCTPTGRERQALRQGPSYIVGKVIVPGTLNTVTEEEYKCADGRRAWL